MAIAQATVTVSASTWTEVADGQANVIIQARNRVPILVGAGTAAPTDKVGIRVPAGGSFSGTGMASGDKLFAISESGKSEEVVVIRIAA